MKIYAATYTSPSCNDHVPLEQSDDATCPYCEIERLKTELKKIASGKLTDHDAWMTAKWALGFPKSDTDET